MPEWIFLFKIFYLLVFTERGKERGREEGEKHQCVAACHAHPTGDLDSNPGMCLNWESNWRPFGLQASPQPTEPQQPGPEWTLKMLIPIYALK